eukprot:11218216-Lingulodinium_polyedra.AAC.1
MKSQKAGRNIVAKTSPPRTRTELTTGGVANWSHRRTIVALVAGSPREKRGVNIINARNCTLPPRVTR